MWILLVPLYGDSGFANGLQPSLDIPVQAAFHQFDHWRGSRCWQFPEFDWRA
jgi:hypothetical protein